MCALKFVEELVELLQCQFSVDGLALIAFIQQVHFQVDEALPVVLDHGISRGDGKLKVKVNQL